MKTEIYIEFYKRDLLNLKEEIALYKTEEQLWFVKNGISNSAGNLALHIVGNLNHFIGSVLGETRYIRDREKEFSDKNIPVVEINKSIDMVIQVISETLKKDKNKDLGSEYPIAFLGKTVTIDYLLTQLLIHLNYHLGQINYHRRLSEA